MRPPRLSGSVLPTSAVPSEAHHEHGTEPDPGFGAALFQEAGDAQFLFDPDTDRLMAVNPMAERLTGLSRDELIAQPMTYWFRFAGKGGQRLPRPAATAKSSTPRRASSSARAKTTPGCPSTSPSPACTSSRRRWRLSRPATSANTARRWPSSRPRRRAPPRPGLGVRLPLECGDRRGRPLDLPVHVAGRVAHHRPAARDVPARRGVGVAQRGPPGENRARTRPWPGCGPASPARKSTASSCPTACSAGSATASRRNAHPPPATGEGKGGASASTASSPT